jgi:hypothetical protein
MTQTSVFTADSLAAHAVCAAAGVRDGLRTAQFYARDLANADGSLKGEARDVPFLSRIVGWMARITDTFLSWAAQVSIALILPSWRNLPSPFDPAVIEDVSHAISHNSFIHNPRFNSYFFRAANHIIARYFEAPSLVLEHRVDAARRSLAGRPSNEGSPANFLARTLIALVRHDPISRVGKVTPSHQAFAAVDTNVAVFSTACVALLFASEGRPSDKMDEDEFFEVTGALIGPRLARLAELIAVGDEQSLATELTTIMAMY